MMSINFNAKIYVAGHSGMVGSALVRLLKAKGFTNIITRPHAQLDLLNQAAVVKFFEAEMPDQVYFAAAKVGGIYANNAYPAEFLYQNLMMEANVIHQCFRTNVKKLLFLGSSCIYPKLAVQPITEDALLTGKLEPTNEAYAIAKIAGIKLCESYNRQYGSTHQIDYRSIMPTNLYGPGDNYDSQNSHVIPALIRRFHEAKIANSSKVTLWGSGTPKRDFLYVDDMAEACIFLMNLSKQMYERHIEPMQSHLNAGYGSDISIADLAVMIANVVGYHGEVIYDGDMPDGTPRKVMDSSKLHQAGWMAKVDLHSGLSLTYENYLLSLGGA